MMVGGKAFDNGFFDIEAKPLVQLVYYPVQPNTYGGVSGIVLVSVEFVVGT